MEGGREGRKEEECGKGKSVCVCAGEGGGGGLSRSVRILESGVRATTQCTRGGETNR